MKRSGPEFHIDFQEFVLEVHVTGYRVRGESIVILFKEGQRTFYSIVIDSYYKKHKRRVTNRTDELLTHNNIKVTPMVVMTHPHEDHIKGMEEIITSHTDDQSCFYYPGRSFDIDTASVKLTNTEKTILKLVRAKNKSNKTLSNPVGITNGGVGELKTLSLYDIDDVDKETPLEINIVALTPVVSVNEAKASNTTLNPNDLSVSLIIDINGYYLYFGADTPNEHIVYLDREIMSGVRFVKIPHHASDTSICLTNFFQSNQLDYACCTTFDSGDSHLPLDTVLDNYKKKSKRVDVAGCASKDKRRGLYGELCYQFKLGPDGMRASIQENGVTRQV